jgi:hypothetical protein
MKYVILAIGMMFTVNAFATEALMTSPTPDYAMQALSQRLTEEINIGMQWRAAALALQDQNKALQKQLDEAKAPKTEPTK